MSRKVVATSDLRATTPVLMVLAVVLLVLIAVAPASARAQTSSSPVLAQGLGMGDKPSAAVRSMQRVLHRRGYDLGAPGVDGRFGPLTDTAVRRFQADYGLAADGVVGAKTHKVLGLLKPRPKPARSTRPPASQTPRPTRDRGAGRDVRRAQPASTVRTNNNDNPSLPAVIAAAALAALCVALGALLLLRRRTPEPVVAPITHGLYVEGRSEEEDVGEFRGHAVATAVTGNPDDRPAAGETRYLVNDVRKPAPVWVRAPDIRRAPSRLVAGKRVIGYVTLSHEAGREGADAPAQLIAEACDRAGWELVDLVTDRDNGRGLERPGLTYALRQVAERKADGLVVSDLRRLCRSIIDLGTLMEWFRDARAGLVALDLGVDTSTPVGEELAAKLIMIGEWERERISRRTRSGLEEARAGGGSAGRPAVSDRPELAERITTMRTSGMTLQAIADQLNAEAVPTMRGGTMWRPSSVQAALGYRRPGSRSPRDQLPSLEEDHQN